MKKCLVFVLVISMAVITFSACGGDSLPDAQSSENTQSQSQTSESMESSNNSDNDSDNNSKDALDDKTFAEEYSLIVNGKDITDSINVITVDDILYAEGETFIESIFREDYQIYNYNYEEYYGEPLEKETIYISSWHTESILMELRINSNTVIKFSGGSDDISEELYIENPPVIIGGKVYIPMGAFLILTGQDWYIK